MRARANAEVVVYGCGGHGSLRILHRIVGQWLCFACIEWLVRHRDDHTGLLSKTSIQVGLEALYLSSGTALLSELVER